MPTLSIKKNFIVIDDSKLDCHLAEKIIRNTDMCGNVSSFLTSKDGLEFIIGKGIYEGLHTIMIVDLQMPVMNGYEFAEAFSLLSVEVKDQYTLYIINSSDNKIDTKRIQQLPVIKQLLNKPITSQQIIQLLTSR